MRPAVIAVFAAAAVAIAPAALAQARAWSTQTFATAGFSVEAPVALTPQAVPPIEGGVKMNAFSGVDGDVAYAATSTDISSLDDAATASPDAIADAVMAGALQGSVLVSSRPSVHSGGAARDFILRNASGVMVRNRIVVEYPWVFSNTVAAREDNAGALSAPDADRFLASVRSLKPRV